MVQIKQFGERSDIATYSPYDPGLADVFDGIKNLIRGCILDAVVEHVGSSSIPGVGGRNVLDVAVLASPLRHDVVRNALLDLGFQPSPFEHYLPLLVATALLDERSYPVLLYVVAPESDVYSSWIAFRNHMRQHSEDAAAYDRLKQQTIAEGNVQGDEYQNAKAPFIIAMMKKIVG